MPRRFNAEISHCSRARSRRVNAIRPSGIPFPTRRCSRVADIGSIANIEKRQSPALSDVMNTRKILPAPSLYRFRRCFSAAIYQKKNSRRPKRAN